MDDCPPPISSRSTRALRLSTEALSDIDVITDDDIADLRSHLEPEHHETFDRSPVDKQLVLTALFRLGIEKLVMLNRTNKVVRMPGLHDINTPLTYLFGCVPELKERWRMEVRKEEERKRGEESKKEGK
jgi:hypothetical protein